MGERTRPSNEALTVAVDALLESWDEQVAHRVPLRGRRGAPTYERQVAIVLGLAAHTAATVRAVRPVLPAPGLTVVHMPLVRAALETAVTAVWIAQVDDAAEAFANRHVDSQRLLQLAFLHSGDPTWSRLSAAFVPATVELGPSSSGGPARSFEQRCSDLNGGRTIYALYRALSAFSHPSVATVDEYLVAPDRQGADEPSPFAFRMEAEPFSTQGSWVYVLAISLLWSSRAVTYLTQDRQYRSFLQSIARELHTTLDLTPTAAPAQRAAAARRRQRESAESTPNTAQRLPADKRLTKGRGETR